MRPFPNPDYFLASTELSIHHTLPYSYLLGTMGTLKLLPQGTHKDTWIFTQIYIQAHSRRYLQFTSSLSPIYCKDGEYALYIHIYILSSNTFFHWKSIPGIHSSRQSPLTLLFLFMYPRASGFPILLDRTNLSLWSKVFFFCYSERPSFWTLF